MERIELVSRKEAALRLGVKPQTLAKWACTRRYALPFVKIGGKVMYCVEDLNSFIRMHTMGQGSLKLG